MPGAQRLGVRWGGGERAKDPDPLLNPCAPPTSGETRRILSVQPTYAWTCFSHSLLNVSPMPVESSPPLPCPTPCHLLPNCTSCLDSKGADGGWQHCVWSSSLQQVPHPAGDAGGPPRPPRSPFSPPPPLPQSSICLGLLPPSHLLFLPTFSPHISFFLFCLVLFSFLATSWGLWGLPQPGIELVPMAVKAQSPNHWTTREVPESHCSSVFRDLSLCPKPW